MPVSPMRYPSPVNPAVPEKAPIDSRSMGLLVVAAILLLIILLRWGNYIVWSAR